jgi:hypothetical protein
VLNLVKEYADKWSRKYPDAGDPKNGAKLKNFREKLDSLSRAMLSFKSALKQRNFGDFFDRVARFSFVQYRYQNGKNTILNGHNIYQAPTKYTEWYTHQNFPFQGLPK